MTYRKKSKSKSKKKDGGKLHKFTDGLNLSGPTNILYLTHPSNQKKIIIVGDEHFEKTFVCKETINTIEIDKYFEQLFNNNKLVFDVFIEQDIPDKYSLLSNNIIVDAEDRSDYMTIVRNFLVTKYKYNEKQKVHFTDIRFNIAGFEKFLEIQNLINLLNEVKEMKRMDFNFIPFFTDQLFISSLYILAKQIDDFVLNKIDKFTDHINLPQNLIKEINKFKNTDEKALRSLLQICADEIDEFTKILMDKDKKLTLSELNEIQDLFNLGLRVSAYINDLYTVLRIMKNENIRNSIIFTGDRHFKSLKEYFEILNFTSFIISSKEDEKRCVKNILTFEEFFYPSVLKRIAEQLKDVQKLQKFNDMRDKKDGRKSKKKKKSVKK
jgi:hypothetical protein